MKITIRNTNFIMDEGSEKATFDYINSGNWEPYTFNIFDYFISKDDVVFDLGCWYGVTSLYLANLATKVYAIDPDPVCFEEITKNLTLNPDINTKIHPFQLAISNKSETIKLFAREKYGASSSSILQRNRDEKKSVDVNTISLLEFITQEKITQVDFIKMDIEGAEFLILPTLKEFLEQSNYPTLYVSFHYSFLNENEYAKRVSSKIITKLILKVEQLLNVSFLKSKIDKNLQHLFNDLKNYQYIYTHKGEVISNSDLLKNPSFIQQNELIFTNKKWPK